MRQRILLPFSLQRLYTMLKAPIIGIERHRIGRDGDGVTTLVAFHGCPLKCRYCLNPQCHDGNRQWKEITPQQLLETVAIDNLYFLATGGGITFGGGEPAMRSEFIEEFCKIAPQQWNITLETSLHVARSHVERLLPYIDSYIVDVKETHLPTYRSYTRLSNRMVMGNLRWLARQGKADRVEVRLPLIPSFNNDEMRADSRRLLAGMGFTRFDEFTYIVPQPEGRAVAKMPEGNHQ